MYAQKAVAHGGSRAVLEHQITTRAHTRLAAAPTNFDQTLAHSDSELVNEATLGR
ncbi:putative nuclease of restriction endonuclease-like (RecB) superfamily [Marisediminicola sp. UYEF4]